MDLECREPYFRAPFLCPPVSAPRSFDLPSQTFLPAFRASGSGGQSWKVTKWYDPNAGTLKDALVACGKGTKAETSSKWDLPTVITYDTKTDTTALGIKVVYDKNVVSSCAFAAS